MSAGVSFEFVRPRGARRILDYGSLWLHARRTSVDSIAVHSPTSGESQSMSLSTITCALALSLSPFQEGTGPSAEDFEQLVSLGVFNSALMNDAVYKFKRYEDASLSYAGIDRHEGEDVGLYDTVLTRDEIQMVYERPSGER